MIDSLVPAALRRLPFTFALAFTVLVTAAVTGTLTRPIRADEISAWGFGADDLAGGRWLQLPLSIFQTLDPYLAISMLATVLALVGACEYRLGTPRAVVVFALSHIAGSLAVIAVTKAFAASGSPRAALLATQEAVGASAGSIGALGAWLMFFPPRWRAALIAVCSLFLAGAFAGQVHPWDIAHVAAFVVGLGVGGLWHRRATSFVSGGSSRERRLAMAWLALIVGVAAALTPFTAADGLPLLGTRARFGERGVDVVRWAFLVAAVAAWVCAPALRRGERTSWRASMVIAAATSIGFWQPGAPGVEHILSILLLAGLVWWRREFCEPPGSRTRPSRRTALAALFAALGFGVLGFVAMRFQFAPPLGWEGSVQMALSRLRFDSVRTPNWDSAGAHWFLEAFPFVVYGCAAVALIAVIGSGFSRSGGPGESSSG